MSLQILHVLMKALHLQVTLLWTRQYMSQEILLIQAFHPQVAVLWTRQSQEILMIQVFHPQVAVLWTRQFMYQEILEVVTHLPVTSGLLSIGCDN